MTYMTLADVKRTGEYTLSSLKRLLLFFSKNFGFARKLHTSKFVQDFKKYVFGSSKIFLDGKNEVKNPTKRQKILLLVQA